ncbi:MAG: SDR family oxidoreductase [Chloroflexi bacterium]|nr:SDR family oxidoreductase [Chloroflexota bacterium]
MNLKGKRVIVTGAATGIGRATAIRVAAEGAVVAVFDVNDGEAQKTIATVGEAGGKARFWHVDVTSEADVRTGIAQAIKWLGGGPDALLHLAGILQGPHVEILEFTEATWDRVIDVNLKGSFLVSKHVAGYMEKAGRGVIVLTASGAGVIGGSSSFAYGASKGGVHGLAMVLAGRLGPKGIRVNDIAPGALATPLKIGQVEESFRRTGNSEEYERAMKSLMPPEGVASVMAFLASDDADYVKGTIFTK